MANKTCNYGQIIMTAVSDYIDMLSVGEKEIDQIPIQSPGHFTV